MRIEDVAAPSPAEDKVLVQVEWCGICGSDLNEYAQGRSAHVLYILASIMMMKLTMNHKDHLQHPFQRVELIP